MHFERLHNFMLFFSWGHSDSVFLASVYFVSRSYIVNGEVFH
jgi:hypothetical protein